MKNLLNDQPELFESIGNQYDLLNSLHGLVNNIIFSLSRTEILLFEIRKFSKEKMCDPIFSVINDEELQGLILTYSHPLKENIHGIKSFLHDFNEIIDLVYKVCLQIYTELKDAITTFTSNNSASDAQRYASGTAFLTASLIMYIATEMSIQIFAGVLGGGGILGLIIATYVIYNAKKKFDIYKENKFSKIHMNKIDQGHKYRDDIELMDNALNFFGNALKRIKETQCNLNELGNEKNPINGVINLFDIFLNQKLQQVITGSKNVVDVNIEEFNNLLNLAEVFCLNLRNCL